MIPVLLVALLQAQAAPAPAVVPVWPLREATDANGKKSSTASIRAEDGSGRLVVRCDTVAEPIISIQYLPKSPLAEAPGGQVTVTFDETNAEIAGWEFPGGGAYFGEPVSVFLMVQKVAAAKKIRVSTENAAGEVIESVFAGPGSEEMFAKVYAACGFPYAMPSAVTN